MKRVVWNVRVKFNYQYNDLRQGNIQANQRYDASYRSQYRKVWISYYKEWCSQL